MRKYLFSAILCLLSSVGVPAQDYPLEIQTDKKVIHVDQLGLAENTPLIEILNMIPELVMHDGDGLLENFDVFLDSKSLLHDKEVYLGAMKLHDIEKIEITTSATASQQANGMAGAIKIVTRALSEGLSGNASVDANTLWNVRPGVDLNYRTDKFEVRGSMMLENYRGESMNYVLKEVPGITRISENNIGERYFQETGRLYLKYNPTPKDQLKVWVLESVGLDDRNIITSGTNTVAMPEMGKDLYRIVEKVDTGYSKYSKQNLSAFAEYEHIFRDDMKITLSADYIRDVARDGEKTLDGVDPKKPQTIRAEAKFVLPFLPAGKKSLNMTMGGNTEYIISDIKGIYDRSLYASPFLELKYDSPKWKLNTGVRYQYYGVSYDKTGKDFVSKASNDITFNINSLWQVADNHAIRFYATKNLIRPTFSQVYPDVVWDVTRRVYVMGNKDLYPATMYSFDLDYITDWCVGEHYFIADVSFGYDRADGLVNTCHKYDDNQSLFYLTYVNSGINDIFNSTVNFVYSYGVFSVALAGNWYHNIKHEDGKRDNLNNYNISLTPLFCFRNDWTLSVMMKYNGAKISDELQVGDCLYSGIRISKTLGKWIFSAALSDILGNICSNNEYRGEEHCYTLYDPNPRFVELGVTYLIGR